MNSFYMFSNNPQRGKKKEFSSAKIQSKKLCWLFYKSNKIVYKAHKAQHTTKCASCKNAVPPV